MRPATLLLAAALAVPLAAAAQPVQKTPLQEQDFPGPPNHTVLVRARIAPGAEVAPHTHPGAEMAYIVRGEALVRIAGRADQRLGAGGSFAPPPGAIHSVRNLGAGPLIIVSTYVVDRNKPIATPAGKAR